MGLTLTHGITNLVSEWGQMDGWQKAEVVSSLAVNLFQGGGKHFAGGVQQFENLKTFRYRGPRLQGPQWAVNAGASADRMTVAASEWAGRQMGAAMGWVWSSTPGRKTPHLGNQGLDHAVSPQAGVSRRMAPDVIEQPSIRYPRSPDGRISLGSVRTIPGNIATAAATNSATPGTIRNQSLLDPHNNKPSLQAELFERERNAVQFGQKRIGENFRQYSEAPDFIRGRSVADVAADLRAGMISPDSLPVSYFEYQGQLVAINNRGLAALAEAGMRPTVLRRVTLDQLDLKVLKRLSEAPIVSGQTIPGRMIPVTVDEAGTQIIRIIELP